ncbi:MAG: chorismate synthase [bacterium]
MSSNTFGNLFRATSFGESHGAGIGVVIDGVPPRLRLDLEAIQLQLDRRRPGQSRVTTSRSESDRVEVLSGLHEGVTTGAPLTLFVRNSNTRPEDYENLRNTFRPGHADFTWYKKYGVRDYLGGGRSSGRETIARVAAGAVARQILAVHGISVLGYVVSVGDVEVESFDPAIIESNPVRCADPDAAARMEALILRVKEDGDSVGGIVEVRCQGVPAGLGDPVFDKLDALIARAILSIGATKGIEFGLGFAMARMRGSQAHDPIRPDGVDGDRAGGILGGVSNGGDIVFRVAVKPPASIELEQDTVTLDNQPHRIAVQGRHDPCIAPRLVPVAEAMTALVLVDVLMRQTALRGVLPEDGDNDA